MSPSSIIAYVLLFAAVGAAFVLVSLLLGRLLRPRVPVPAKLETYECGEPSIGPGFVQFDLRFYVVALLFIVFDVEVAFFFPWATVFGKALQLRSARHAVVAVEHSEAAPAGLALDPAVAQGLRELGVGRPGLPLPRARERQNREAIEAAGGRVALWALIDMAAFFGVLLVGFAYLWRRGDLDWVRAVGGQPGTVREEMLNRAERMAMGS